MTTGTVPPIPATPPSNDWIHRGKVYLLSSNAGWPASWSDFDHPRSGHVDPALTPPQLADERYYFRHLGDVARRMQVDGVVFTTPGVPPPRLIAVLNADGTASVVANPDGMRMHMEGRVEGLRARSSVADAGRIRDGLAALRAALPRPKRIGLYTGAPPPDLALQDAGYCENFLRDCVGPYLEDGHVDFMDIDSGGDRWSPSHPEFLAVTAASARLYPLVRLGAEGNPQNLYRNPWRCSYTTDASARLADTWAPWRMQLSDSFNPVVVGFTVPRRLDFAAALAHIRLGRCIAVQDWQVGYDVESPSEGDRHAWEAFLAQARPGQGAATAPAEGPARVPADRPNVPAEAQTVSV